jgi:hypothetical protein
MSIVSWRILKVVALVLVLGGFYALAVHKHAEREAIRQAPVVLTDTLNANLSFGGSGANRTLWVQPVPNGNGSVTITVTVHDGLKPFNLASSPRPSRN